MFLLQGPLSSIWLIITLETNTSSCNRFPKKTPKTVENNLKQMKVGGRAILLPFGAHANCKLSGAMANRQGTTRAEPRPFPSEAVALIAASSKSQSWGLGAVKGKDLNPTPNKHIRMYYMYTHTHIYIYIYISYVFLYISPLSTYLSTPTKGGKAQNQNLNLEKWDADVKDLHHGERVLPPCELARKQGEPCVDKMSSPPHSFQTQGGLSIL